MSIKTNIKGFVEDQLPVVGMQLGLVAMAAAATLSSLPDHSKSRVVVLPNQPVIKVSDDSQTNNPLRREREETAPHFVSYAETQRTPGRAGKY